MLLFLPARVGAAETGFKEKGCVTAECHPAKSQKNKTHPDKTPCVICHQPRKGWETQHPTTQKDIFNVKENCSECHEKNLDYLALHPPVAAGNCSACHTPHGSKENKYLYEQAEIICYNCHEAVSTNDDVSFHGDVKNGKCFSCHNPHGSSFLNLLEARYSQALINDYTDAAYEVCFTCHKKDLLLHPKTSYNTNFRDNKKNLHYLHVNKKRKGRACKTCHAIHASRKQHLIAEEIEFGTWRLPINFEVTQNGGRCSPGCHKPAQYDRTLRNR